MTPFWSLIISPGELSSFLVDKLTVPSAVSTYQPDGTRGSVGAAKRDSTLAVLGCTIGTSTTDAANTHLDDDAPDARAGLEDRLDVPDVRVAHLREAHTLGLISCDGLPSVLTSRHLSTAAAP